MAPPWRRKHIPRTNHPKEMEPAQDANHCTRQPLGKDQDDVNIDTLFALVDLHHLPNGLGPREETGGDGDAPDDGRDIELDMARLLVDEVVGNE